jgi:hypothetical protein
MSNLRDNLRGQKSLGPLKMSLEMAHKVIVPQKKIMSRSFLNSGTLIVKRCPSVRFLITRIFMIFTHFCIKSICVGDFGVKILIKYFSFRGS